MKNKNNMKNYINNGIALLLFTALFLISCKDERALVVTPDNFAVNVSDYSTVVSDTFVVNVNQKVTFNFPDGCPDQILFYSGESGYEYRFGNRSLYKLSDSTLFESKITINTAVNSFDATLAKDYSLVAISGLGTPSVSEFIKATKTELKKLRVGSTNATTLNENFVINASSPLNMIVGDVNLAIRANSADATKNFLSIVASSTDSLVTNTETRDYGYVKNGLTVVNKKKIKYSVVTNTLLSANWAQFAPDSTIAPSSSVKVANASGYSWNRGELGAYYSTTVVTPNTNGVNVANAYPVTVSVPLDVTKVVTDGSPSEAWLVSRPFNPCAVTADAATVIKKVDQSSMKYYQYIYKEKGVYKASFVGLNVGTNGTAKVAREFVILVQ